jgi:large subunit ribosomal protein L17
MRGYRKLGKTTPQRKALLRNQVTALIQHGKIVTTAARAEEVQKIAEKVITYAVRNKDDFETVTIKTKVVRKDKNGHQVKQIVDKNDRTKVLSESHRDSEGKPIHIENGIKVKVFDEVEKTIQKDKPGRLNARRQILRILYPVTEKVDPKRIHSRKTKRVDLTKKLFDEIAPKYADKNGGYTRITKIGQRKGDAALMVLLELV